ncbi:MAG: tetratricopeptide repeat protein, partial [Chitinophagales bacterium]|nr:tetratricopeptide repeat protein [Chitinophagales bacterium]
TYGMVLTETNDLKTAKMALEKSIQLDSSNADTWYNYGNWYAKYNDFQTALNCYKKIESRNAATLTKINAYNNSGNCYAVLKQYDNAISYYKKVLTLDAKNKSALQNLVLTYNNIGQPDVAASYQAQLNQ